MRGGCLAQLLLWSLVGLKVAEHISVLGCYYQKRVKFFQITDYLLLKLKSESGTDTSLYD